MGVEGEVVVGLGDLRREVAVVRGDRKRGSGGNRRFKERGSSWTGRWKGVGIGVWQEEEEKVSGMEEAGVGVTVC